MFFLAVYMYSSGIPCSPCCTYMYIYVLYIYIYICVCVCVCVCVCIAMLYANVMQRARIFLENNQGGTRVVEGF